MFCGSQIDPSSSDDWVLSNTETVKAQTSEDNNFEPIPSFSLGSNFNAEFLAIEVDVLNAKSHWSSAGYVYQQFAYPGLSVSTPTQWLKLNTPNLVKLETDADYQYELVYSPRKYFLSVTVKVWRYVGNVINPEVNTDLSSLEQRLKALEDKIDLLL